MTRFAHNAIHIGTVGFAINATGVDNANNTTGFFDGPRRSTMAFAAGAAPAANSWMKKIGIADARNAGISGA